MISEHVNTQFEGTVVNTITGFSNGLFSRVSVQVANLFTNQMFSGSQVKISATTTQSTKTKHN